MEEFINLTKKLGFYLNDKIEYKIINGIGGMWAKDVIKKGEELCKCPIDFRTKIIDEYKFEDVSKKEQYDKFNIALKQIYAYSKQYQLGEKSEYYPLFQFFYKLNQFKPTNAYFFDNEELTIINSMNSYVLLKIQDFKDNVNGIIERIHTFDPDIKKDTLLMIILNYYSRAWGDGFFPIFDLFNHSSKKGALVTFDIKEKILYSKVDYKKGEQIYDSYGIDDIITYNINYDFYEPLDTHYIIITNRIKFPLNSDSASIIYENVSKKYETKLCMIDDTLEGYTVNNKNLVMTEVGPSLELIEFLTYYCKGDNNKSRNLNFIEIYEIFESFINIIDNYNKVENINIFTLPEKLHKYYYALKKEKYIINNNRKWLSIMYLTSQ